LVRLGFDLFPADIITPVIPVIIDDEVLLCQFFHALLAAGIYTNPIFRPAAERCMIRVSCMATHTSDQIDQLLNTMAELGRQFGIIE
jgi:7-keto-8-aminopelargonate synthetase-like enzyme